MSTIPIRYPVLLVHGTGFRDRKHLGYWGRIPQALEEKGVPVYFGNQDSWATIEKNAEMIQARVQQIVAETQCEKVNIIAHSKGGLEARYLVSSLDSRSAVASVTTVSTPHYGSKTMDGLWRLPKGLFRLVGFFANLWFRLLGDSHPDFFNACRQFTTSYMEEFNQQNPDAEGVYYQSFATAMKGSASDAFLFLSHWVVRLVEGENDGLVTPRSAAWTNFGGIWRSPVRRGISHADSVDLRRKNFTKKPEDRGVTDIRRCYVEIAHGLASKGY